MFEDTNKAIQNTGIGSKNSSILQKEIKPIGIESSLETDRKNNSVANEKKSIGSNRNNTNINGNDISFGKNLNDKTSRSHQTNEPDSKSLKQISEAAELSKENVNAYSNMGNNNPMLAKVANKLNERLKRIKQKNQAENNPKEEKWKRLEEMINNNKYRPVEVNKSIERKAKMLQEQILNPKKNEDNANKPIVNQDMIDIINKKPIIHNKKKKRVQKEFIIN